MVIYSLAHLACSLSLSKVIILSLVLCLLFLLGFGSPDPNRDAHRDLSSIKQPSMAPTKKIKKIIQRDDIEVKGKTRVKLSTLEKIYVCQKPHLRTTTSPVLRLT